MYPFSDFKRIKLTQVVSSPCRALKNCLQSLNTLASNVNLWYIMRKCSWNATSILPLLHHLLCLDHCQTWKPCEKPSQKNCRRHLHRLWIRPRCHSHKKYGWLINVYRQMCWMCHICYVGQYAGCMILICWNLPAKKLWIWGCRGCARCHDSWQCHSSPYIYWEG